VWEEDAKSEEENGNAKTSCKAIYLSWAEKVFQKACDIIR